MCGASDADADAERSTERPYGGGHCVPDWIGDPRAGDHADAEATGDTTIRQPDLAATDRHFRARGDGATLSDARPGANGSTYRSDEHGGGRGPD